MFGIHQPVFETCSDAFLSLICVFTYFYHLEYPYIPMITHIYRISVHWSWLVDPWLTSYIQIMKISWESQWPCNRKRFIGGTCHICLTHFLGLCKGISLQIWPKILYITSICWFLKLPLRVHSLQLKTPQSEIRVFVENSKSLGPYNGGV